ncbi:MAG: hypothetical protein ABIO94_00560 [Opitutaceae bacterium]
MKPANFGPLVSGDTSRGFRFVLFFFLGLFASLPVWLWLFTR